jgi:2,3-bisphosphoglycerate-dependent phosphoglycerate mutase
LLQLFFIRHGQSTNNRKWDAYERDEYLVSRTADPDLTALGEAQAKKTADFLAASFKDDGYDPKNWYGFGLTHLYCSLQIRAVRTGLIISEKIDLPLHAWTDLHETGGIFLIEFDENHERVYISQTSHGRSYFEEHYPSLNLPSELTEKGWWQRSKEPREEYPQRAKRIVEALLARHGGKDDRVGIITHGGIFNYLMTVLFDIQAENYWILMNNCGISRIDIEDNGHIRLVYLNRTDFLSKEMIT